MSKFTRREIWRHNSFLGLAASMKIHLQSIFEAKTTTESTKRLAASIASDIEILEESLKTRNETNDS